MTRLLFDIGGTNMRLALGEEGHIKAQQTTPTPPTPGAALIEIQQYLSGRSIDDAAGGIAGVIENGGVVRFSPYLPGWEGCTFSEELAEQLQVSARVENDAAVAALAEARTGAGKGKRLVAYVAVGTGIGGALVEDCTLLSGALGIEPGKQIIDWEQERTLETLAGGRALETEFGQSPALLSREVLDVRERALATGLYNLARIWSPDCIVLNGSLINDRTGYRIAALTQQVLALACGVPMPELVPAAYGDESGLQGALLL